MPTESSPPHPTNLRPALARTAAASCALQLFVGAGGDSFRRPQNPAPTERGVVVEAAPEQPGGFKTGDVLHAWVRAGHGP